MRRRGHDYISLNVDIQDAEVEIDVGDLSDSDIRTILEEAGKRGLSAYYDRDYAALAMEALMGKRYSEAIALLDRALHMHPSVTAAPVEYMKAMAAARERQQPETGG